MRTNFKILPALRSGPMIFAIAALFSIASSMAQMTPGGMPQQPTSPTQGSYPGTQPGTSPMNQPTGQDPNNPALLIDKAFVKKALEGGMAEVQLGQLALQKSSNEEVKQFAQKMVDDHTKLGDMMKQVAQQMDVKIPDSPSKKQKSNMAKLQALNGDAFDKAYIEDMVKDHKQDEKDFKYEAQNASNPALKEVAAQGEQVVNQHLQLIEQIAQKNNVGAK